MADLISRQAAIDEVLAWLKDSMSDKKNGKPFTERLKDLPSAQSEIIRCKYCKHYGVAWLKKDGTDDRRYKSSVCLRGKYAVEHKPDWYCGDAERREE